MQASRTSLPSGLVTFVFSDIEGSTRLLRRLGDRYGQVLDRHFELLRAACERHGGHDLGTAGDSLFLAFPEASSAVAACAEAQRAIGAEAWPGDEPLRVRMGIHTGLASPRDEAYVALAVHQAARVMAAAHGGQVLLSSDVVELLGAHPDVGVVSIGRFRLRDFDDAVELFAITGPGLAADLPAVRAVPVDGHNLVVPPTSFLGRTGEVAQVMVLLEPGALVTLTGPGGVGKTRLATEVGLRVASRWVDGVWLVDLAAVQDAALIGAAVAEAIGAPPSGSERWDDVIEQLRTRCALVVLDNCEHLRDACGRAAESLLAACGGCAVLATSRAPLGLGREQVVGVRPLPGADAGVQLFVDRAQRVRPDLVLDDVTHPIIGAICEALDGLPLAIELAAARLGVLSLTDIHDGLDDRFTLLRTSRIDLPARQHTMEDLLAWSDRLLSAEERACLHRLGVFGSSFSVPAATAAVADDDLDGERVAELLWSLVDKSLVVADLTAGHTRYRLLATIRAFARRRLADDGEVSGVATRLARWYVDRIGPRRRTPGWAGEVGVELDNLRGLVPLVAPVAPALAQEVAVTIGQSFDVGQGYRDGVEELARYVDQLLAPTPMRVSLLACLADLQLRCGDVDAAAALVRAAVEVRDEVGAPPSWDDIAIGRILADVACRRGDHAAAVSIASRALDGDLSLRGRARMLSVLGIASSLAGDVETARSALEDELAAYERLGDEVCVASAHGNVAELAMRQGDVAVAARHQRDCLTLALALGAPVLIAYSAILAARIAGRDGDWVTAATLHAAAAAVLEASGLVLYDDDRRVAQALVEAAGDHLGADGLAAATTTGRSLAVPAVAVIADRVLTAAAG